MPTYKAFGVPKRPNLGFSGPLEAVEAILLFDDPCLRARCHQNWAKPHLSTYRRL